MKRIVCALILLVVVAVASAMGDNGSDPILIRIGDRQITRSAFESAYLKNNVEMQVADPKTVEEYLELYIDFNLKVVEAMALGLDTLESFREELQKYRSQLARPYFRDDNLTEQLVRQAYERLQYDIRASHILVTVEEHALPSDTLEAYNRIMELRKRHLEGEDFGSLAAAYSDDSSAKDTPASGNAPARIGNKGDLLYFTVFNMLYPFESAAYNTPVGEVSMPVRTRFGYHLIKVTDRLPAMGTARVAHIMFMTPPGSDEETLEGAREKVHQVHEKLLSGEDFESLAGQYSEDQSSASRGGEMAPFQSNRMVPEFIAAIARLENPGDISPPVRSQYGWHIIKLLERTPPGPFEEVHADLAERVSRDARGQLSQDAVVRQLKENYGFGEDMEALHAFYEFVNDDFFLSDNPDAHVPELESPLFWFGSRTVYQKDFASYLRKNHSTRLRMNYRTVVNENYSRFVAESLIAYEDQFLESKYPEFEEVMNEYHDGILLFEITDQMVWSKAVKDTAGMNAFFEENRNRYVWEERLHATVYSTADEETAHKARELIMAQPDREDLPGFVEAGLKEDGGERIGIREQKLERGDQPLTDQVDWSPGVYGPLRLNNQVVLVHVHGVLPSRQKEMNEVRGMLIADYQSYLEKKWVKELREKYEVFVDREVLRSIEISN
jgi:peptidyl-prolyl cis-trans isomerase SurA